MTFVYCLHRHRRPRWSRVCSCIRAPAGIRHHHAQTRLQGKRNRGGGGKTMTRTNANQIEIGADHRCQSWYKSQTCAPENSHLHCDGEGRGPRVIIIRWCGRINGHGPPLWSTSESLPQWTSCRSDWSAGHFCLSIWQGERKADPMWQHGSFPRVSCYHCETLFPCGRNVSVHTADCSFVPVRTMVSFWNGPAGIGED
ncbi:uncharacterized protein K489DRAFT_125579 [Dissoconium aciculare CBS 342.82]|uniref:Uncharacterized protein n=1 Tax=Dissoconium aciculare CBS 342.82 TaxID=1314786 RepID=A0A6J3MFP5_9PEZI|nr:uncharacterized protein K489DRAFT_125579 [Dissoconium aciculare CBS 342.82]KAF1826795.1 hypothetical protein K489DRAFT_125579 [Dissoconium aciculare CBS 342.82]